MNYFLKYTFGDKKLWVSILLVIVIILCVADFISYLFVSHGFFNLLIVKSTLIISFPLLFIIAAKNSLFKKRLEAAEKEGKIFEEAREKEIFEILKNDSNFTTHCYECIFFNKEIKGCGRDRIFERVKEINIGRNSYCLYWKKNQ